MEDVVRIEIQKQPNKNISNLNIQISSTFFISESWNMNDFGQILSKQCKQKCDHSKTIKKTFFLPIEIQQEDWLHHISFTQNKQSYDDPIKLMTSNIPWHALGSEIRFCDSRFTQQEYDTLRGK